VHRDQTRVGDGAAFFEHLREVGLLLEGVGGPDALVAAGLLHDTVERTATTTSDLTHWCCACNARRSRVAALPSRDRGRPPHACRPGPSRDAGGRAQTKYAQSVPAPTSRSREQLRDNSAPPVNSLTLGTSCRSPAIARVASLCRCKFARGAGSRGSVYAAVTSSGMVWSGRWYLARLSRWRSSSVNLMPLVW
jgi:hypothetical protein